MNNLFLGAPTREDMQTLDQLRRQLLPTTTLISGLQADMFAALHQGKVVDWPHIRHSIHTINSYLTSINGFINGSYRHEEEKSKDSEGKPRVIYRDVLQDPNREKLEGLHVFPQAPFPIMDEKVGNLPFMLLNKRLGAEEEEWVEERLRKASEFAHMPPQWEIEPKKPVPVKEEEEDDDMKGWDANIPTKRVKGTLNEDEIREMWSIGHKTAFDKTYQQTERFDKALGGEGQEREGETPAEEEGEDEEMEDGEEEYDEEEEDGEDEEAPPPAPVVMIQSAPPSVHKPVPGAPVMALGFVHRFMTSGEVKR